MRVEDSHRYGPLERGTSDNIFVRIVITPQEPQNKAERFGDG